MHPGRLVSPGDGRTFRVGPNVLTVKAGTEHGHTLAAVFESTLPPGGGYPLAHVHEQYEEIFYVLDGEIEYRIGDDWLPAGTGSTVCVPRGVVHAFRNVSPHPARHLALHSPAAAMTMIEEIGTAQPDQYGEILARHHTRLTDGPAQ